jgi:hypothetical protein
MKKLLLALAALSLLAGAIPAKAGTCTTQCSGSYNNRTCWTNCY